MTRALGLLTKFETFLASCFVLVLTGLVVIDVVAREVFALGLPWAQKGAVQLMIWAGFLGAALMAQRGDHLRPEIGDKLCPPNFLPLLERARNLCVALFSLALAYYGALYVLESREFAEEHVVLQVPLWPLQLVIPWTFLSMGLRYLWYTYRPLLKTERSLH